MLFRSRPIGPVIRKRQLMPEIRKSPTLRYAEGGDAYHAAISELVEALHSKDVNRAAEAFQAAFLFLEKEPHEEYDEHEEGGE